MIFFTSDLHFDHGLSGRRAVQALADELAATATREDVLILGGDLGNCDATVAACLDCFRHFPGRKLGIAGNHDVWVDPGESSWDRYKRLSDLFAKAGIHPLEEEPLVIGGVGFAGMLGWYDYSFRDDIGVPYDAYVAKALPSDGLVWGDLRYAHFGLGDEAFTEWQLERLERHLGRLASCESVVVATHHVGHKRLLVHPRALVPHAWRFLNAFLGSSAIGELVARFPNVKEILNGHIHRSGEVRVDGRRFTSLGSAKRSRQYLRLDRGVLSRRELTV